MSGTTPYSAYLPLPDQPVVDLETGIVTLPMWQWMTRMQVRTGDGVGIGSAVLQAQITINAAAITAETARAEAAETAARAAADATLQEEIDAITSGGSSGSGISRAQASALASWGF